MRQNCWLHLSDGDHLEGKRIGAENFRSGEMVFTTGMVGYSEAITDPSYYGQILVFSYPLIGNYGIPDLSKTKDVLTKGFESSQAHVAGIILATDSDEVFHWNSYQTLDRWLKDLNVPGIIGIDTRHLIHKIRNANGLFGKIVPESIEDKVEEKLFFNPAEHNIIAKVSTNKRKIYGQGTKRIGLVDCGVKWNIIRQLVAQNCEVELLPWDTDLKTVDCSGWLLSNGPGNPQNTGNLIANVRSLLNQPKPILGICLGHQILALAAGAKTKRMAYGHRSHNQPVYRVGTKKGYITSQNHGYVVCKESLPDGWKNWFLNANDQTNEGIYHERKPFRSVQFHPEAAGGPRDTSWIVQEFLESL